MENNFYLSQEDAEFIVLTLNNELQESGLDGYEWELLERVVKVYPKLEHKYSAISGVLGNS